jgi:hypothetical protein
MPVTPGQTSPQVMRRSGCSWEYNRTMAIELYAKVGDGMKG